MRVAANTFEADYEEDYDTEYGNDMDESGYLTGIELTLYHDRFIDLVKNQAFKVIRTEWRNREFHVIIFDHTENVFKSENVIYKLTDECFLQVKIPHFCKIFFLTLGGEFSGQPQQAILPYIDQVHQ
ncbi:hypothetical protein L1N85_26360 [Paenibacillus alkaliterrae]|uniref:hypothetical protein n=1 Tax=Paenibacillus alkaliterrae TaxID=320909 RepID=UPI001F487E0B|nr:hypothetical protein [Paenibacillus alkaliterrae]MCF2941851.1 hypothetical protein [Paenibacillus alkaliterrae]